MLKSRKMVDVRRLIYDVNLPLKQEDRKSKVQETALQQDLEQERDKSFSQSKALKIIKIFLASSSELKDDRDQFEIFIRRENDNLHENGIYLKLVRGENFVDAMSPTRLQDEYNKAAQGCDIFVSLFHTKVGKYTKEEFLKALETFQANGKPLIYTYFNQKKVTISRDNVSVIDFQDELSKLGHYFTR